MKTYILACAQRGAVSDDGGLAAPAREPRQGPRRVSGTQPGTRVHPEVMEAMKQVGVDLSAAV
jgi:arsenate reductase